MAAFRLSAFWSKLEQLLLLVKSQSNAGSSIFIMYKLSHVSHMLTTVPLPFFPDTNLSIQTSDDHPIIDCHISY
ncbi:hypothetical protein HYDPIDRAFT_117561 [Hydnomerulius pinastri MD-312]|uniref:Uncharacterized protein n=1 Tax=Hydnomerulius pinastri MD-312 TaxID=994086 RepID=A0A0C9VQU4_9AGAM|nr:hypothetical protein HYDPIDRAFT_117561 [Hydnomerulius pinastri MD-312]